MEMKLAIHWRGKSQTANYTFSLKKKKSYPFSALKVIWDNTRHRVKTTWKCWTQGIVTPGAWRLSSLSTILHLQFTPWEVLLCLWWALQRHLSCEWIESACASPRPLRPPVCKEKALPWTGGEFTASLHHSEPGSQKALAQSQRDLPTCLESLDETCCAQESYYSSVPAAALSSALFPASLSPGHGPLSPQLCWGLPDTFRSLAERQIWEKLPPAFKSCLSVKSLASN